MVTFNNDVATIVIPIQPDLDYTLTYTLRGSGTAPLTYGYEKGYDEVMIKAVDVNGYVINSLNGDIVVEWQLIRYI